MDKYKFSIDLNNPSYAFPKGKGFDAMTIFSVCFDFPTDDFIINWNGIELSLSYKYTVSHIIFNVFDMLNNILDPNINNVNVSFGTSGIHTKWQIEKDNTMLNISSTWEEAPCSLDEIKKKLYLRVDKHDFICEWKKLIDLMMYIIKRSKIKLADDYYSLKYLKKLHKALIKYEQ